MVKALDFICNRYASTRTYMIQMLIMECYRGLNREDLRNAAKERRENYIKTGIPLTKFKNDIDHVLKLNTPRALEDFEREYGVTFSSLDDTLEPAGQESTEESTTKEENEPSDSFFGCGEM
jgi:hypothetical protein